MSWKMEGIRTKDHWFGNKEYNTRKGNEKIRNHRISGGRSQREDILRINNQIESSIWKNTKQLIIDEPKLN